MSIRRQLPPFSALRGFEAAARHLSFKRAAQELCLTQSAISHQVRQLEDFLGKPLFHRTPNGVSLTAAGRVYALDMREVFDRMASATKAIRSDDDRPALALRCSPGFATRWLLPRLPDAQQRLGDVEISLSMATASRDDVDTADVRINCGYEVPPGENVEVFMTTRRAPVCSPEFLAKHGPVDLVEEMLCLPLLRERAGDQWDEWLAEHAGGRNPTGTAAWLDDGYASLTAAEASLGIALGHLSLIARELAVEKLVRLFDITTSETVIYTLTSPHGWERDGKIVAFRNWLFEEIGMASELSEGTIKTA